MSERKLSTLANGIAELRKRLTDDGAEFQIRRDDSEHAALFWVKEKSGEYHVLVVAETLPRLRCSFTLMIKGCISTERHVTEVMSGVRRYNNSGGDCATDFTTHHKVEQHFANMPVVGSRRYVEE